MGSNIRDSSRYKQKRTVGPTSVRPENIIYRRYVKPQYAEGSADGKNSTVKSLYHYQHLAAIGPKQPIYVVMYVYWI